MYVRRLFGLALSGVGMLSCICLHESTDTASVTSPHIEADKLATRRIMHMRLVQA